VKLVKFFVIVFHSVSQVIVIVISTSPGGPQFVNHVLPCAGDQVL
jgi:hypothetical protein